MPSGLSTASKNAGKKVNARQSREQSARQANLDRIVESMTGPFSEFVREQLAEVGNQLRERRAQRAAPPMPPPVAPAPMPMMPPPMPPPPMPMMNAGMPPMVGGPGAFDPAAFIAAMTRPPMPPMAPGMAGMGFDPNRPY